MKKIVAILILLFNAKFGFACFCVPTPYCDFVEEIVADESSFVFQGTFIQKEPLGVGAYAFQFRIDQVYIGEVITPNSPLYTGEEYINTDTTVWLREGSSAACLRALYEGSAIFAVFYNSDFPNITFGYVPTTCRQDYFPISEDGNIAGFIWDYYDVDTLTVSEFEDIILSSCTTSTDESLSDYEEQIAVYPQPTRDMIYIEMPDDYSDWEIILLDAWGRQIQDVNDAIVDLSGLNDGLYFLRFRKNGVEVIKKALKI